MDDLRTELREVKEELSSISLTIQELLERQDLLEKRKKSITNVLNKPVGLTDSQDVCDYDRNDFTWSEELDNKRSKVFHIDQYRPLQLRTMNATMSGNDCILVMPTGGGKSLCFQLPALVSKGISLVVSPLISLMEDQVMALKKLGVNAELLCASSKKADVTRIMQEMSGKTSKLKLLYVTPEKMVKSKRFMTKVGKMYENGMLARLVIDEVHCCSQWGHDFRPDYKFLGIMKQIHPGVPILGLTATATATVLEDVKKMLGIQNCLTYKASFNRPNLYYEVHSKPTNQKECMDSVTSLILTRFKNQSGIIYCFSRKDCEDMTVNLQQRGIKAGCYHAYLDPRERSGVHQKWLSDNIQVVVATVAFGMGIDKPDVRFVIHHSLSKSMENFYQESGRAGRDNKTAYCILYYRFGDIFRQSSMVFTEQTGLQNLHGMVRYCIDLKKCRRSLIARHFGETWDEMCCNQMCDHCDERKAVNVIEKDVKDMCGNIISLLRKATKTKQRLTALKLLDAMYGKGGKELKFPDIKLFTLSRDKGERVIVELLLQGYLKEDFHFTPYNTISYLLPGPRSNTLNHRNQIMVLFKGHGQIQQPTASTSSIVSDSVEKARQKKPVIFIINKEKSAFTPATVFGLQKDDEHTEVCSRDKTESTLRKRKTSIESNLHFGDDGEFTPKKRKKLVRSMKKKFKKRATNLGTKKIKSGLDNTDDVIIIEDSDSDQTSTKVGKVTTKNQIGMLKSNKKENSPEILSDINNKSNTELNELYNVYTEQLDTLDKSGESDIEF